MPVKVESPTMAIIKQAHYLFYVMGRREKRLPKIDLDEADLAKGILKTSTSSACADRSCLRMTIFEACRKATESWAMGRRRRVWLEENASLVAVTDGSPGGSEDAYSAWLAGVTDELAYALEEGVLAELAAMVGGDEDDDEDNEEEDDEEEEEDGGEDEDDDDEEKPRASPTSRGRR